MNQEKIEGQTKKCDWCHGRGFFYIIPERGKIVPTDECTICNGTGRVEVQKTVEG